MDWQETAALTIVFAVVGVWAVNRFRRPRLGCPAARCTACGGFSNTTPRHHLVIRGRKNEPAILTIKKH
jgi:hypothetical protein